VHVAQPPLQLTHAQHLALGSRRGRGHHGGIDLRRGGGEGCFGVCDGEAELLELAEGGGGGSLGLLLGGGLEQGHGDGEAVAVAGERGGGGRGGGAGGVSPSLVTVYHICSLI
jgi:rRNA 2'-O-methyltransferase fibrillarin